MSTLPGVKVRDLGCFCGLFPSRDLFLSHMSILPLLFDAKRMICTANKSSLTQAELISKHVCAQKREKYRGSMHLVSQA